MEYNRGALDKFKGYEFQYYYLIKILLEEQTNIDYILFDEGCEDIDIKYLDNKYTIIQVKYHESSNAYEGYGKESGLTKVFNAYMNNYNNTKNKNDISQIIYFINYEKEFKNITIKELCDTNTDNKYNILINKYNNNEDNNDIKELSKKLLVEYAINKNIYDIITNIFELLNTNTFFNFGSSYEYKKEILLCKITKNIIKVLCNKIENTNKIYIKQLFENIKIELNEGYKPDYLINEIIEGLNSENHLISYQCNEMIKNNILTKLNLNELYKILDNIDINNNNINNIKILILNNILSKTNNYINLNNYENIKFIISHLFYLLHKDKSNGNNVQDVISNINTNNYCKKYQKKK